MQHGYSRCLTRPFREEKQLSVGAPQERPLRSGRGDDGPAQDDGPALRFAFSSRLYS
jgi:hypothetical protein